MTKALLLLWRLLRLSIFALAILARPCHSLSSPSSPANTGNNNEPNKPADTIQKGYRVCTASPCSTNGSYLLLDALQSLSTPETTIKEDYCLGGCCSGTVMKPLGTNSRRQILPLQANEAGALETASKLLQDVEGLDPEKFGALTVKLASGERVLSNSQDPDVCQNCGVGLQLYRGNCAKCGKYPY
mgnify:CR=1 FL=1